jgi:CDP-diacylglycerol--serine O-phosphatidyltransferase
MEPQPETLAEALFAEPRRGRFRRRRRRRERRAGPRGLYLLPHLVTTAGLFFGFYAILQAFTGDPDRAALGIVLAGVCDALDGRLARFARSTSRFGLEYDSIADIVSFGVAPAALAFSAGDLSALGRTGLVMAFLYVAGAALRLARFNVAPSRFRGRFEGMPSPAAAGVVASTQWFASFLAEHGMEVALPPALVAGGVAVLGLLMVSSIPYRSFKELDLRHSYGTLVLVVFAIALVIQEPSVTLFAIGVAYAVSGPAEWMWRWFTHRPLEEIHEAVAQESAQG